MRHAEIVAVQMELTNACSCACAECPRELHMTRRVGMMNLDLAKGIVEDALEYYPKMGFNLNGLGEPLLYKWMPELIRHIAACGGQHIDFFTSLKAPTQRVLETFSALAHTGIDTMMAITKHLYTVDGEPNLDLEQFSEHFGMAVVLPGNVKKNIGIVLTKYHTQEDIDAFEKHYSRYNRLFDVHIIRNLNPWFNAVADMAHPDFGAAPPTDSPSICDEPFRQLHFGWQGNSLVCCSDDIHGELELGKWEKKGDIKRIWEGAAYRGLRDKHNNYDIDMAPCTKCERCYWSDNYTGPKPKPAPKPEKKLTLSEAKDKLDEMLERGEW